MLYLILAAALVGLDQLVKGLVRANISLGEGVPFLPHVLQLTYVQNTGAAFSLFAQHTWILSLVSTAASILLVVLLVKKVFPHPFARFCLSLVLAGAVGNLIDRVALGYVTDMFQTLFMNFAVFNVADICIVCGGIAFCAYYLLLHGKEDKSHDAPASES
ncbi:signal peptidase II [uncultured Flavonifractor sp.]|uniref:signal peptidase II n=1 Tax=uncultured Flavonifractor sp. TaxID=1193534 RepID=UPI0026130EF7|nr:signal peptidase II [uncultured Flavonifractor sp.]